MSSNPTKRLRIFAGPNGSGKSTLAKNLPERKISLGVFVNADEIEKEFRENGFLSLNNYRLASTTKDLRSSIDESGISSVKLNDKSIPGLLSIQDNNIYFNGKINSYIAADIAQFICKIRS